MPTALITGIDGQDGSYLAEHLLGAGYTLIGMVRDPHSTHHLRIGAIRSRIELIQERLLDQRSLEKILKRWRPTEIYNFAAKHPASSEAICDPVVTGDINGLAVVRILEAVRAIDPSIRFFQASSAQIFGRPREAPQNENTPFYPENPYAIAKLYAHGMTLNYREAHGLFACSCILFNHESPRRGEKFVTRKITLAVARIKAGLQKRLYLDDLDARRDWGYAPDYARAAWLMLQAPVAGDYVIATGETHSVRELCQLAFECVGLNYEQYVVQSAPKRESEGPELVGDASKARRVLGWRPTVGFEELVRLMVDADLKLLARAGA